jgi:O-antigen/teichoic acid export membrane protein
LPLPAVRSGVFAAIASRLGVTGLQGLIALVTTPLLLGALGVDAYGAYALVVALPALLPFLDLGVGAFLTGSVARATAETEDSLRAQLSAAVVLLAFVGGLGVVVAGISALLVDWQGLLGLEGFGAQRIDLCVFAIAAASCIALPLSLATRLLVGLKRTHVATLTTGLLASVVSAIGIVAVTALDGPLWAFVGVQAVTLVLGPLACAIWVRRDYGSRFALVLSGVRLPSVLAVARAGAPFVVITLATAIAYETDMIVVSRMLDERALASYAITLKYFNLVYPAVTAAGFALWPVLIESRGARATLSRWTLVFAAGGAAVALLLLGLADWFVDVWTQGRVVPPGDLFVARALFLVLSAAHYPAAMAVLALGRQRFQAVTVSLMALVNLPLSIFFAAQFGVAGPVWASCCAFGLLHALPQAFVAFRSSK